MRSCYPLAASILLLQALPKQAAAQNALDFDGVDDKVTVPGGASLFTGGTGMSLACWAYPSNAAPGFPDFDGLGGIRNEMDADFYLLQVAPANVLEARFRNSNGEFFTLEYSGLLLNAWQFLVFTYNGSQLTVYANGVNVATAPANGTITDGLGDLLIGDVNYQGTDFFLRGRMDEVSVWNRGLSQAEVSCIYANGVDVNASGLRLYYKMDQGIGGGNNTGISALLPSAGTINGILSGFALTGATSNFVSAPNVGNNLYASICQGEVYSFHGQALTTSGVYGAAYDIGEVCDSLVTLNLAVTPVNVQTIVVGGTITSLASTGTWQWLDCNNGYAPVPGATAQNFTPAISGSYAVRVTRNSCSDTSACTSVTVAGIAAMPAALQAKISPVPARDLARVAFGGLLHGLRLSVLDLNGRQVWAAEYGVALAVELPMANLDAGTYLLRVCSNEGCGVYRLMKE